MYTFSIMQYLTPKIWIFLVYPIYHQGLMVHLEVVLLVM